MSTFLTHYRYCSAPDTLDGVPHLAPRRVALLPMWNKGETPFREHARSDSRDENRPSLSRDLAVTVKLRTDNP